MLFLQDRSVRTVGAWRGWRAIPGCWRGQTWTTWVICAPGGGLRGSKGFGVPCWRRVSTRRRSGSSRGRLDFPPGKAGHGVSGLQGSDRGPVTIERLGQVERAERRSGHWASVGPGPTPRDDCAHRAAARGARSAPRPEGWERCGAGGQGCGYRYVVLDWKAIAPAGDPPPETVATLRADADKSADLHLTLRPLANPSRMTRAGPEPARCRVPSGYRLGWRDYAVCWRPSAGRGMKAGYRSSLVRGLARCSPQQMLRPGADTPGAIARPEADVVGELADRLPPEPDTQ